MIEEIEICVTYFNKDYLEDIKNFGWVLKESYSKRCGRTTSTYQVMTRDSSSTYYNNYRNLQNNYEEARNKLKEYVPMESDTVLILFLILIIPGIVYVIFKKKQKKSIEENNKRYREEMQNAISMAQEYKRMEE